MRTDCHNCLSAVAGELEEVESASWARSRHAGEQGDAVVGSAQAMVRKAAFAL